MNVTLRPINQSDWFAFQGSEKLPDGSEPLIGETDEYTVVVSGYEAQAPSCVSVSVYFEDGRVRTAEIPPQIGFNAPEIQAYLSLIHGPEERGDWGWKSGF